MLLAMQAWACLWDYDTVAAEAAAKPDLADVITGRFERNPPLYYQMRLDRVTKELAKDPSNVSLYDDAAVACDRLGRDAEAIAWIEKKRHRLEALGPVSEHKQDWYRTFANEGTFYAHRWLHDGAPMARIAELERARALIAKAINVNPEAHFGREVYQLMILDWLLGVKRGKIKEPLGAYLQTQSYDRKAEPKEVVDGLAGLIRLGNAWQSVDVFTALSTALSLQHDGALGQLARFRADELKKAGGKSLYPSEDAPVFSQPEDRWRGYNYRQYQAMRENADRWHREREAYMLARLRAGRHPDTDNDFWAEYKAVEPAKVDSPPFWTSTNLWIWASIAFVLALLVAGGILSVVLIRRGIRAFRASRPR
jgi:hypothetical protein